MSEKKKTLEEFISEYVNNKVKSNSKQSYAAWLKANGIDSEKIYSEKLKDIETDYKSGLNNYGAAAESLSRQGLSESGYSDYLNGKVYSEMQRSKRYAKSEYENNIQKNEKGYADYLDSYIKNENKTFASVVKTIDSNGIIDYDAAYRYAVNQGLSEDTAKIAAKTASDIARKKLKDSVIRKIVSAGLTETQVKEYAMGLGLSEAEALELGRYAKEINNYYPTETK